MGKISTSVVKTSFSKNNISNYKLSILCGIDSLYYCVSSSTNETLVLKKFDYYTSVSFEQETLYNTILKELWSIDPIIALPYPTIHIAFIAPHYTIVPNKLYQDVDKAAYLAPLKQRSINTESYQVNNLDLLAAKLVFSVPQIAINFFQSQYTQPITYYNSFTPLLNSIATQMQPLADKHVWINVHPTVLQVVLFDGQDLIFSNQFPFQSEKDFLYFVLLIYSQFKLDPETAPLHISGQLVKESAIYKKLYHYIRNISFLEIPKTHQLNTHLMESPEYFFFDLLSIAR